MRGGSAPARRAGEVALTLAAVVGAACLVAFVAGLAIGVRPLVFRSGSMSPGIPTGSLGFVRTIPSDEVRVGDVVSVPYGDTRVTHRVLAVQRGSGPVTLRLKGDANEVADPQPYPALGAQRLWFSVPVLGGVIAWLSKPPGAYLLALYAALMITLLLRRPGKDVGDRGAPPDAGAGASEEPGTRSGSAAARAFAASALALVGIAVSAAPGRAAWSDGATVSGTQLSAATVPAPATFECGALGIASVTFTWAPVAGATSYRLHYGSGGSSTVSTPLTSWTITTLAASGTAWVEAERAFASTTWTSGPSATRTYSNVALVLSSCS